MNKAPNPARFEASIEMIARSAIPKGRKMSLHDIADINKGEPEYQEVPHNIDAEQGLLGAILMDNQAMVSVADIITQHDFYDPLHGALFGLINRLIEANQLATPVTLKPHVQTWPAITDDLQVWQYLGRLIASAANRPSLRAYARQVADLAARRRIIGVAQDLLATAMTAPADTPASVIVEDAERGLFEIVSQRVDGREVHISDAVTQALESVAQAYERGGQLCGVPTGLVDLDGKMGGLQDSDLIILAGRPSMGKTALATTIAFNVAREVVTRDGEVSQGAHVHFFSQEMSARQLALRLISERAEIASDRMRRGDINEAEFRHMMQRARDVSLSSITVDETGGITLAALAAKARRTKRKSKTKLIIIDYLQLMSGAARAGDNRVQEITKITMGLKALAKELDVPILALSQLSRKVEERSDKRPQLSDLRESGSIEQDADVVMFVYRDEYYIEREKPDEFDAARYTEWQARMERTFGKAEVILGKQRHGSTGTVQLSFQAQFTRFANLGSERRNG